MYRRVFGFVIVGIAMAASGQDVSFTVEDAARAVVFLHAPAASKKGGPQDSMEIGTGFLANLDGRLFLITADHVASLMNQNSSVTIAGAGDAIQNIPIAQFIGVSGPPKWHRHRVADVAVIEAKPASTLRTELLARALPPKMFVSKLEAPPRNRPLTVVGFPLGLGVVFTGPGQKISAISKESKAASGLLTLPRSDTKKPTEFFVLDNPSVGGFSGSPVFILPASFSDGASMVMSATTLVVGLIHGTASDETGGKFALVVPSSFITETLENVFKSP